MDAALRAINLCKTFNGTPIVDNVSFSVEAGEVFGLIGPNGAGKTTTIRLALQLIQPDAGEVSLFGHPISSLALDRIGYLPEERGLYRQAYTDEVLIYLGRLKGLSDHDARRRAGEVLDQLGMTQHARKKVSELSRGMGQLIQFGATIIHQPDLVILDEPFSGLDPVNTLRLKDLVYELQNMGVAVIFSTHLMSHVEELCDRVLMIDHGQSVLYGPVSDVKERYRNNSLFIRWNGPLKSVAAVERWELRDGYFEAFLAAGATPEQALREILDLGGTLRLFQLSMPSLDEIFIRVAGAEVQADE